jgi:hypothetical protein
MTDALFQAGFGFGDCASSSMSWSGPRVVDAENQAPTFAPIGFANS